MQAPYGRMKMSHMVADTHDELIDMVKHIGVDEKWIQKAGLPDEHFDICESKRTLAVQHGAVSVSMSDIGRIIRDKRNSDAAPPDEEKKK